MLASTSLGKESVAKAKTARAPKAEAQPRSREQEQSLEEFTPPKFSWHIGNIAVSAPGDSGPPNQGENGAQGGPAWHFARPLPLPIQAKLEVGAVDDPLEREADRIAEQVMRMPKPQIRALRLRRNLPGVQQEEGRSRAEARAGSDETHQPIWPCTSRNAAHRA